MTLLSKKEYLNLMKKNNLIIQGKIIEKIKNIETGPRCVLRVVFKKC